MKKFLSLFVTFSIIISLTGCDFVRSLLSPPESTSSLPDPIQITEDIINNVAELDEAIAFMCDSFAMSAIIYIRDLSVWEAIDEYYYNNPEILAKRGIGGIEISYIERSDSVEVEIFPQYEMFMRIIIAHETENLSLLTSEEEEVYNKAFQILNTHVPNTTTFEKALAIHSYLTETIEYEHNYEKNENAFNIYGALVEGMAVCKGYAHAYKMLLHFVGIENIIITGEAGGDSHAWNLVNYGTSIEPEWYHVDVTWNDQEDISSNKYFNVTDWILSLTHTWKTEAFPAAYSTSYNYFWYKGLVAANAEAVEAIYADYHYKGIESLEIVCTFDVTNEDLNFVYDYGDSRVRSSIRDYGDNWLLTMIR